jgi:GTPase involved in cell partitioning and DNA repair
MFGFLNKNKINSKSIKEFSDAIKAINFFMLTLEWEKAEKAILEIKQKEKKSLNILLEKIDDKKIENSQKTKDKLAKENKKNLEKLSKLEEKLNKKRKVYNEKREEEKFKIKFKKVKEEIETLTQTQKT